MSKPESVYFPTLDAFRFFAFLKVFMLHLPYNGDSEVIKILKSGGGLGVLFFFVLSGFLITYKLTTEIKSTGKFDAKVFFMKRALRIWPLFYLILIVVHLLPHDFLEKSGMHMIAGGYPANPLYSFAFLENYRMLITDNFPKTTPLSVFWSLCIEEHFYIFWLVLFSFIPLHKIHFALIFGAVISVVARYFESSITHNQHIFSSELLSNLDLFALGGCLGYFVSIKEGVIKKRYHRITTPLKWIIFSSIVLSVILLPLIRPAEESNVWRAFMPLVYGLIFTILTAMGIFSTGKFRLGPRNWFSIMGTWSYGLYVYHLIFIHILLRMFQNRNISINSSSKFILFALIALTLSLIISYFSYRHFESKFIKIKNLLHK